MDNEIKQELKYLVVRNNYSPKQMKWFENIEEAVRYYMEPSVYKPSYLLKVIDVEAMLEALEGGTS